MSIYADSIIFNKYPNFYNKKKALSFFTKDRAFLIIMAYVHLHLYFLQAIKQLMVQYFDVSALHA